MQSPGIGDPLEDVLALIPESEAGADHQVLDRAGDEHLARSRGGLDPGGDVHRETAEVITNRFALSGVKANPQINYACAACDWDPTLAARAQGTPPPVV